MNLGAAKRGRYVTTLLLQFFAVCLPAARPALANGALPDLHADKINREIEAAVDEGVAFLELIQRPEGRWLSRDFEEAYPNAMTALGAYALRVTGKPPTYWRISRVANAFTDRTHTRTALARRCTLLLWYSLDEKAFKREIEDDIKFVTWRHLETGGWGEPRDPTSEKAYGDPVATMMAMLATREAVRRGMPTNFTIWNGEEVAAAENANADGGWPYFGGLAANSAPSEGSATAARLAVLHWIYDARHLEASLKFNGRFMAQCGKPAESTKRIVQTMQQAWAWMDEHFDPSHVPSAWPGDDAYPRLDGHPFFLFALSEAARSAGRVRIGKHPWARSMARALIKTQRDDGSWGTVHDTCFALLALENCREPLLVSRLVAGDDDFWHRTPRDAANLTEWMTRHGQRRGTWQRVDLDDHPDDLHAAPVILLTGHDMPALDDTQQARLKTYIERGGTLLASPCCSSESFVTGFMERMTALFPRLAPGPVPAGHPFWRFGEALEPNDDIIAFNDGCRLPILLIKGPASGAWHQDAFENKLFRRWFSMARNTVNYATFALPPMGRASEYIPKPGPKPKPGPIPEQKPSVESTIPVARLIHGGDWWIKPAAEARLSEWLTLRCGFRLDLQPPSSPASAGLGATKLLWLTGTRFELPDAAGRVELKAFLANGGMLIASAACGADEFDFAFPEFAEGLFGPTTWMRVPEDDALLTGAFAAEKANTIDQAVFAQRFDVPPPGPPERPVVYGVKRNDRWIVLYCPYDLAASVTGESCPECVAYRREDVLKLLENMLLYALQKQ